MLVDTHCLSLVRYHHYGRGHDLRPSDLGAFHPVLQEPPHHVHTIVCKGSVILMHTINNTSDKASNIDHFDVRFDEVTKLLRHVSSS